MSATMQEKDIELLGYTNIKQKFIANDSQWRLYSATAEAGLDDVDAHFIYFSSNARIQDLIDAKNKTKPLDNVHTLYAKSIDLIEHTIKKYFPDAKEFEDILWQKIRKLFNGYLKDIKEQLYYDANYVTPRVVNDSDHEIETQLLHFIRGDDNKKQNNIIVLKASAGVGKTTLATKLANDVAKYVDQYRTIPVFIESSHWGKLQLESIDDFWEIVRNSLSVYGSHVPISQELFYYMMRQGVLGFIFDGFDELCSRRGSHFKADEIIEDFSRVADGADAKIIMTTRSLYWDREVSNAFENTVATHELAPFNKQQAKLYFERAFPASTENHRSTANSIYSKLSAAIHNPKESSGRGTCQPVSDTSRGG